METVFHADSLSSNVVTTFKIFINLDEGMVH